MQFPQCRPIGNWDFAGLGFRYCTEKSVDHCTYGMEFMIFSSSPTAAETAFGMIVWADVRAMDHPALCPRSLSP